MPFSISIIEISSDPFKFKLVLKTIGANLKNKNKLIKLESVKSNIDIKTFIKKKFSLTELDINTRTIEIKNLISFVRSIEDNPQIFILEKFVKKEQTCGRQALFIVKNKNDINIDLLNIEINNFHYVMD